MSSTRASTLWATLGACLLGTGPHLGAQQTQAPSEFTFELRIPSGPWSGRGELLSALDGTGFPDLDLRLPSHSPSLNESWSNNGRNPIGQAAASETVRWTGSARRTSVLVTLFGHRDTYAYWTALEPDRPVLASPELAGSIRLTSGDEFAVNVQQLGGERLRAHRNDVRKMVLPPGGYVVSVQVGSFMEEHRLNVKPGEQLILPDPKTESVTVDVPQLFALGRGNWRPDLNFGFPVARPESIDSVVCWMQAGSGSLVRRDGRITPDGEVLLEPAPIARTRLSVLDPDGKPVPAARLYGIEVLGKSMLPSFTGKSREDGRGFVDARPGDRILVLHDDHVPQVHRVGEPTDEIITLQLERSRSVELRVLTEARQQPTVVTATLPVDGLPSPREFRQDAKGRIQLTGVPLEGDVRVSFRVADGMPRTVSLPAGEPLIELVWEPGQELEGIARFDDQKIAADLTIELRDTTGRVSDETIYVTSDQEGRFRFPDVPPGIYLVAARTERDGHTWSGQTRVKPNGDIWPLVLRDEDPRAPGGGR